LLILKYSKADLGEPHFCAAPAKKREISPALGRDSWNDWRSRAAKYLWNTPN
jgi:3-methyladenine DNA glycosylase/8-oxoguanine DNA glycosylase